MSVISQEKEPVSFLFVLVFGIGLLALGATPGCDDNEDSLQATLTPSVSLLALSVNCLPESSCATTQNAALTGNPRQITIQNTGSASATNVSVDASGLPTGTSISSNTCTSTLTASSSCAITLTPGAVASSDNNSTACTSGTAPIAGTVTVSADGELSSEIDIYVLSYGCVYQSGFVYAVDDTTPNTGSMGGTVISQVDQAPRYPNGIIWSSDSSGDSVTDSIYGISVASTTSSPDPSTGQVSGQSACNGNIDGSCATNNVYVYYQTAATGAPINLAYYATGLCKQTIGGYSDWHLPSICEIDAVTENVSCPSGTQSVVGSLGLLIGDPNSGTPGTSCTYGANCLAGAYWSSSESALSPQTHAWSETFSTGGGSSQTSAGKDFEFGVRCARELAL